MEEYTPIDCALYDGYILMAQRKTPITFIPNLYNVPEGDYIKDLETRATKEEFMIMNSGIEIRLDKISNQDENIFFLNFDEDELEKE